MRPNWFLGLPISAEPWLATLPPLPAGIRAFSPGDLHATIAFLGPVEERAALAAWDELAWPLPAQTISLGDVVPLGPPARYSALSALFVEGREAIEAAMTETRARAWATAHATPDLRPAKAHVTVARPTKRASEAERAAGLVWARSVDLRGVTLTLDRVALYTWAADRKESLFTIVRQRDLRATS